MSDSQEDARKRQEQALAMLPLIVAQRAADEVGGQLLQEHGQSSIGLFCGHCDFRNDRKCCPANDQGRYVLRDWCGWSRRDGATLGSVTLATIEFKGVKYSRDNLDKLDQAIEAERPGDGRSRPGAFRQSPARRRTPRHPAGAISRSRTEDPGRR